MAQSHRAASRRLFDLAEQQQGFFTTKQAKAAGFAENTHPYHVQAGNWIREHRGIYRLALFPAPDRPDLVLWSLWSRNRKEEVDGVYSHQTALSLYELSDLNPAKLTARCGHANLGLFSGSVRFAVGSVDLSCFFAVSTGSSPLPQLPLRVLPRLKPSRKA